MFVDTEGDLPCRELPAFDVSDGSLGESMGLEEGMEVDVESPGDVGTVDGVAVGEKAVEMVLMESRLLPTSTELVL